MMDEQLTEEEIETLRMWYMSGSQTHLKFSAQRRIVAKMLHLHDKQTLQGEDVMAENSPCTP